jgi:uncharacterized membrane protein (DUF106 family)
MKKMSKTIKTGGPARIPLSKPGLFTLFANIARAAFTGGMLWFIFFAGMVAAFLHVNHLPTEHLLVLLIAAVVVTAFIRGIREWQYELDEYQRDLTEYRMNMADIRNKHQVKKDIVWDRH